MADYVEEFNDLGNITSTWWPVGSTVQLCRVNWDESYRDVVLFDSERDRTEWFDGLSSYYSYKVERMSYLRPGQGIKVPLPYSRALQYNYVRVINPSSPKYSRTEFFYFITQADYVAPSTTLITLQLDVMMSYQFSTTLGRSYVDRGHVALSNVYYRNNKANGLDWRNAKDYLDVPEGLDVGSDYVTVATEAVNLSEGGNYVIVMSTSDLATSPGTITSPNLVTAGGMTVDNVISGCDVYAFELLEFFHWMSEMSLAPWISQCIIAIYTFPKQFVSSVSEEVTVGGRYHARKIIDSKSFLSDQQDSTVLSVNGVFGRLRDSLPPDYEDVDKLLVYPYSVIEVTANTGTSVLLKPQLLKDDDLVLSSICCSVYPFARIGVVPFGYGRGTEFSQEATYSVTWVSPSGGQDVAVLPVDSALQSALWISNFPQFSIVNNNYLSYMASTANTRQWSYESAGWTLDRSRLSNELAFEQTSRGLGVADQNQRISQQLARDSMIYSIGGGLMGAAGQFAGGQLSKGTVSLANTAASAAQSAASIGANQQMFENNQGQQSFVAASNYNLANMAASRDYELAIAGIQAKVQDAQLIAPSQSGQMSGEGFMAATGLWNITVNLKTITHGAQRRVGNFLKRYGYAVQAFVGYGYRPLSSLNVMTKYSYWKMQECYLRNSFATDTEIMAIKGILERGTTVWRSPNDIGTMADDNAVDEENNYWRY